MSGADDPKGEEAARGDRDADVREEPAKPAKPAKRTTPEEESDKSERSEAADPGTLSGAMRLALGGLFFYAAALFTAALLSAYGLVAIVGQAIVAEVGLSRLGVAWSEDPDATVHGTKRALKGFGLGLVAVLGATLLVIAFRAGHFEPGGVVLATLATGLLSAAATSVFHELFFRGLVLRLTSKVGSLPVRIVAAGLASFALAMAQPGATWLEAAVEGTIGAAMACLWLRERGAHTAMGAHAGWLFGTRAVFRGGLFELAGSPSAFGGLGNGPYAGAAAGIAVFAGFLLCIRALRSVLFSASVAESGK